jgi:phosphonatase-like hydrolase
MDPGELELFLFDLAGTTIRDGGRVLEAFRAVAGDEGLAPADSWLTARMGWFKTRVFEELLADAGRDPSEAGALTARFDEVIGNDYRNDPPTALPGAVDSLQALSRAGVKIGFTTGFTRAIADVVLSTLPFGPDVTPDVVVASNEVEHGRPAPDLVLEGMRRTRTTDPGRVGVAGDTPADLEAGTAAGCRIVIGVGHGTHTLDELRAAPHTGLLPDLTGLLAAIRDSA